MFDFLNQAGTLAELGWDGPQREVLWRYNQHYFDDLNAFGARERLPWHLSLMDDWVAHQVPGRGVGWAPYPTSLRIANWIKWSLRGNTLSGPTLHSLAIQARWLSRRIEWHLLGNHLFVNGKALLMAGLYFQGDEAQNWLARGLAIVQRELPEQVLPDGGNFERSPMYHALFLEDLLDLINIAQAASGAITDETLRGWCAAAQRMCDWLEAMCHPDGELALFNDTAIAVAPSPAQLRAYAQRLGVLTAGETRLAGPDRDGIAVQLRPLSDSGYFRLDWPDAVALCDAAPIGPDYLPAHAHADSLSFELSIGAQRVIVHSGTSCYGTSPERVRQRGTAAHNTVQIDGQDSSEVWGGFRVARRARTVVDRAFQDADGVTIEAHHDGYRRLPGRNLHRRRWFAGRHRLCIDDVVSGEHRLAQARFHFHPDLTLAPEHGDWLVRAAGAVIAVVRFEQPGAVQLVASTWHPGFGQSIPGQCLVADLHQGALRTIIDWGGA